jgi:phosphoserine phosphatase
MSAPRFATVALDVDSTISGIEGVDWLARRRGDVVARRVASLTDDAMRGAVPLERVYGARLSAIRPRRDDLDALARAYVDALAPKCVETVVNLRRAGVDIILLSGGLRSALFRLVLHLGLDIQSLHAVDVRFDALGAYAGFDEQSPLTTAEGKRTVLERIGVSRPALMVGDGTTDLAAREAVDSFVAFTGFVRRASVIERADAEVASFTELATMVLA